METQPGFLICKAGQKEIILIISIISKQVMGDVLTLLTYWKWGLDLGQIGCDLKRKRGRG
jgi:hypothetical protein